MVVDVEQLLDDNNVKKGWKRLMLQQELKEELDGIWSRLQQEGNFSPKKDLIFKALSYFKPRDTRVIIVGQDPIPARDGTEYATGLSFSMDCCDDNIEPANGFRKTGHSIWKVHEALKVAGILQGDTSYPCTHEGWARKKVLLLNTALTVGSLVRGHLVNWKSFIVGLLKSFVWEIIIESECCERPQDNIFVMLWGDKAQSIWEEITWNVQHEGLKRFIVMEAVHPTNSHVSECLFIEEVSNHFEAINNYYPDIFSIDEP